MTVEKSLVFSCAIVLFLHPCAGPVKLCAEEPQDAILKRVEAAISVHAMAVEKAKSGLLGEIEARIKAAAASKDLGLQETLRKEAEAFQANGSLPADYLSWDSGQPDNGAMDFMAVLKSDGRWHDSNKGGEKFAFVCEWVNLEPEFQRK